MPDWFDPAPNPEPAPLPDLHPLVAQTLLKRGFRDAQSARAFLDPLAYSPCPAAELPGLGSAVERILSGIRRAEPMCVWGDFDVDGQTSTTVLVQSLQAVGARVSYHIPLRQTESHGVNIENLARVISQGAQLVITCDTGISAVREVEYARSRGVEMIITDHHDLPAELPQAVALVNPKLLPADHALASLAGVGVAYKLAEELLARLQPNGFSSQNLLDLTAMGLVADLAVLRDDARYLVQRGLQELRNTQRLGLRTVMELAELSATHLSEEHIGFALGPRFNAIGRLGDSNPVVELLTTSDPVRARVLAAQLEGLNVERKLRCDQVTQAAEAQLQANPELLTQPIIILAHPQWPGGIVGIVASRLVERYRKPVILMTAPEGQLVRGSARSIEGLNITAAITEQKDLLSNFGGHPMAAGLALEPEHFNEFRRRMARSVERLLAENGQEEGRLEIDGWLGLADANLELAEQFEGLAPFGPGNPRLTLASHALSLKSSVKMGKNKEHLRLTVSDEQGVSQQVLWWDGGGQELPSGKFDLAYALRASDWRGSRQAQLEMVDFRVIEAAPLLLESRHLEVLDYRNRPDADMLLKAALADGQAMCWAEAAEKKRTGGLSRQELAPAQTLVIWSIPAGRQELLSALEIVKPEKVLVFGIDPGLAEPRSLLERLAGLVKFTLNQKAGSTSLLDLAAATAHKQSSVRLGLECLAKQGHITVTHQADGQLHISANGQPDALGAAHAAAALAADLEETRAYRAFFSLQAKINLG